MLTASCFLYWIICFSTDIFPQLRIHVKASIIIFLSLLWYYLFPLLSLEGDDVRPSLAKKTMTSYHWEVEWVRRWLKSPIFSRKCHAGSWTGLEIWTPFLSSLANLSFLTDAICFEGQNSRAHKWAPCRAVISTRFPCGVGNVTALERFFQRVFVSLFWLAEWALSCCKFALEQSFWESAVVHSLKVIRYILTGSRCDWRQPYIIELCYISKMSFPHFLPQGWERHLSAWPEKNIRHLVKLTYRAKSRP